MPDEPQRRATGQVRPPASTEGHPTPVADLTPDAYSASRWDEEAFALFAEGRDPSVCPRCGTSGFYGPRVAVDGTRYRACRFCGLFQEVGGAAQRAQPTRHDCATWPEIARAPYIWWAPPGVTEYPCPFCGGGVRVPEHPAPIPATDPLHPWWKVPHRRTRFWYASFWDRWPYTKGRIFL
jgi:hypothetical protein